MVIPKSVKVGQLICPINVIKLEDYYGRFNRVNQVIEISNDLKGMDILRMTTLHEIIHAMETNNTNIDFLTEPQVDNIATGIYSLIKDNKKFIKWVQNV